MSVDSESDAFEYVVAETRNAQRADDWALVMAAESVPARLERTQAGLRLLVRLDDAQRAEALLRRYQQENPPTGPPRPGSAPVWSGPLPFHAALAVSVALLAFFLSVTGPRDPGSPWFARGSADAARIASGELWRTVTALTLHADLAHVLSNAVIGGIFLALAFRALGPGLGLLAVVLAGAWGNGMNALLRSAAHVGVGASTALFGAVGLLAGVEVARRTRGAPRRWRHGVLVPIAAGLGLLAMLGTGAGTDVWAHGFGFLAGALLGLAGGLAFPRLPRGPAQTLAGALALALVAGSWWLAWGAVR